jgi:hypothetical protein
MSVQLFFQTHGRFPTTDEFRLIRTFRQHQPLILFPTPQVLQDSLVFTFVKAARAGNLAEMQQLMPQIADHPKCSLDSYPLIPAQPNNQENMVSISPPPQRFTPTALCAAAQGDHVDVLAFLLDNNATVDLRPPHNRTALLFACESGHFNSMNFLISRGATYFTYSDQQIESYFMSYTIRQSITRRELSYVLPGDLLPGIVLDYLGLGGARTRPIERLAPVNMHNKTSFGAKPIPDVVLTPIPVPHPCSIDLTHRPVEAFTQFEWDAMVAANQGDKMRNNALLQAKKSAYVETRYPHATAQGSNATEAGQEGADGADDKADGDKQDKEEQ